VFLITGLVAFGVYYFLIAKPAAEVLTASKMTALGQTNILVSTGTQAAILKASGYSTRIQDAGSVTEVQAILVEVNAAIQVEQTRGELLDLIAAAADGTYYSATGGAGKIETPELAELWETLTAEVNAKTTEAELEACRAAINSQANLAWRNLLNCELSKLGDNVAMFMNSPVSGGYLTKPEARNYIAGLGWETLRKLKFEACGTVEVPVLDSFQRAPTIRPGSTVNIYVYDAGSGTMENLWFNARVNNVAYSQTDIARISWILTGVSTTDSFSVDIWETIKAAVTGNAGAAGIDWSGYGGDVVERALSANIGLYTLPIICLVEVPDEIGRLIAQYEFQETSVKDIILVVRV